MAKMKAILLFNFIWDKLIKDSFFAKTTTIKANKD